MPFTISPIWKRRWWVYFTYIVGSFLLTAMITAGIAFAIPFWGWEPWRIILLWSTLVAGCIAILGLIYLLCVYGSEEGW